MIDFFNFQKEISNKTLENNYEKVVIIAKRARQIVEHRRDAFRRDLENMGILELNTGQLINTEGWQEVLAKTYETQEAPVFVAQQELEEGNLVYTYIQPE